MDITPFLMDLVERTWEVSTHTVKFFLLSVVAVGFLRDRPAGLTGVVSSVAKSLSERVVNVQKEVVYGLIFSGLVYMFSPGFLFIPVFLALGVMTHSLIKIFQMEEIDQNLPLWRELVYLGVLLLVAVSAVYRTDILNSLSALYLYALLFIKV